MSGVTFFTLGYGDVYPLAGVGRALAVAETGMGFSFLAGLVGYLPLFSQAFSRREATIALLDARAGSPPSAAQMLLRLAQSCNIAAIDPFLAEWERWCAELLESHLSYPLLSYYRSQHFNQSWLAALTTILDTCSFIIVGIKGSEAYQAQLTFAMARHAAVDIGLVMNVVPLSPTTDRLPADQLQRTAQAFARGENRVEGRSDCRHAVDAASRNVRAIRQRLGRAVAVHVAADRAGSAESRQLAAQPVDATNPRHRQPHRRAGGSDAFWVKLPVHPAIVAMSFQGVCQG